jgi:hypothetical protein
MPTNPEWLEHTENAAWDTVQTLRAEIQRERQRVERLSRLTPGWQKLLDAIERVKLEHGLAGDDPAEIVLSLAEKVREAAARPAPAAELPAPKPVEPAPKKRTPVGWFARRLEEAADAETSARPHAVLVQALERVVDDLAHAKPNERLELAVEIGALALSVARASRRSAR